jgi:S1-C subfamily serine protease
MGEQAWVAGEPPLTIGRGLTAATGAIGGLLALAVLWTMLPTHAGRSAGVSVRSTVANSASLAPSSAALVETTTSSRSSTSTTAAVQATVTTGLVTASTDVALHEQPVPTYSVEQHLVTGLAPGAGAIAVAVDNGGLVITTAGAVETGDVVDLRLPDGGIEQAQVLLVDPSSGLAVLAHDTPAAAPFTVAPALVPGDVLSFYGVADVTTVVLPDGTVDTASLAPTVTDANLPEGTPVVNQRGELVALCSHGRGGPLLVSLAGLDQLQRALAAGASDRVWVGVMIGNDAAAGLVVDTLDPSGPAADAGVQPGDVIVTADGVPVPDTTALGGVLASHQPGDTITLVVHRAGTPITIAVVLGAPRSTL